MPRGTQLLLVFLMSAVLAVGVAALARVNLSGERSRWLGGPPSAPGTEPKATAQRAATAGHLREAQDEYLKVLLDHPDDAAAMRGLVFVRRQLAGDDPVVLRRQAAAYRQIVAAGVEPPEHYSKRAMELLASASLQAAAAVGFEQRSGAQRASGPPPADVPRGATPRDKGTFAPPTLPEGSAQTNKVTPRGSAPPQPAPSTVPGSSALPQQPEAPPRQAGVPAPSPKAPAQAPSSPAPQGAPAQPAQTPQAAPQPPTGPAPEQPGGGQTAPPGNASDGTIAVVPPTSGGPAPAEVEGSLSRVDCQRKTFVLSGADGDEEYVAASNFTIYVRGVGSQRVADFCGLQRHLGRTAMVWWVRDGDRKIAKSMSVVLPAQ